VAGLGREGRMAMKSVNIYGFVIFCRSGRQRMERSLTCDLAMIEPLFVGCSGSSWTGECGWKSVVPYFEEGKNQTADRKERCISRMSKR
jgi:hypothetical protein